MNLINTIQDAVKAAERFENHLQDNTSYLEWYEAENKIANAPVSDNIDFICRIQRLIGFLETILSQLEYAPQGKEIEMFRELYKESNGSDKVYNVRSICSQSMRKGTYDEDLVRELNESLKRVETLYRTQI